MDCQPAQNLPSIACGHALLDGDGEEPENHAHVLDMCAAPGGKTTHLAAKLAAANNARARVVAFDKSQNKVGYGHGVGKILWN